MAINPRVLAVGGSAALGAYTSDITDNPLTGLLSTGIAGGVGSLLVLPKRGYLDANVSKGAALNVQDILQTASSGVSAEESKTLEKFNKRKSALEDLVNKAKSSQSLTADEKTAMAGYSTNMNSLKNILRTNGIVVKADFETDPKAFVEELSKLKEDKLLKRIMPLLDTEVKETVNMMNLTDQRVQDTRHIISNAEDEGSKVKKLSAIFQKQMGNSVEEANRKASMIVSRSVGDIEVLNGSASFIDKADNRSVNLPLTSYDKNGIRYHNAGNGNAYSVKGFTPFMGLVANDSSYVHDGVSYKPTFEQVRQGMAPEMMLEFLDKDKPISSLLNDIKSHISYNSDEVSPEFFKKGFEATSPSFINDSSIVRTGKILNINHNGTINRERPFRNIKLTSDESGKIPENETYRSQLINMTDRASSITLGTSNNSVTDIQSAKADTLGLFTTRERNLTGAGLRDTTPIRPSYGMKAVSNVMENVGGNIQYSSAQVVNKLSIFDRDTFSKLSADLLGDNSSILADGYGMYNMGHGEEFAVKRMKDLRIPLGTDTIISNKQIAEAIKSGNVDEWIQKNGAINIGNDILAYTPSGQAVQLKQHYSDGAVKSAFINTKNELVLRAEGIFNPNAEGEVKYHSIGSKVLARGIDQKSFDLLATAGELLNQGAITYNDGRITDTGKLSGLSKFFNGNKSISLEDFKQLRGSKDFVDLFGNSTTSLITSAEHDGLEKLQTLLHMDAKEIAGSSFLQESGADLSLGLKNTRARDSVIAGFLTLETKAAEDLTAHLVSNLLAPLYRAKDGVADSKDFARILKYHQEGFIKEKIVSSQLSQELIDKAISSVTEAFRYTRDRSKYMGNNKRSAMNRLTKAVSVSGMAEDLMTGRSVAIGTAAMGNSGVGANNAARMSWNAYFNLRKTGYTREQLGMFGKVDDGLVYELQGVLNETKTSSGASINDLIRGREKVAENLLETAKPEDRLAYFKSEFKEFNATDPYIKYKLNYSGSNIKELNFSLLSSSRSGKFSVEEREILKSLDKQRLNIMGLDIDYSTSLDARGKREAKERLRTALKDYEDMNRKLMKGDLIKNSISLYSDASAIKVANPIGGQAKEFIESIERDANGKYKAIANFGFMSSTTVEQIANSVGIEAKDIKYEDVIKDGKNYNLKRAGYLDNGKFVPFNYLMTREPAQGDLSSQLLEVIMDPTLKGKTSSIHLVEGQYAYTVGMLGDFDQDTLQNLYSKLSNVEYESMKEVSEKLRASHGPYLDVEKNMSPKALDKKTRSLTSFSSMREYEDYLIAADNKGKVRKVYAPMATTMAMNYTAAIDLAYGDDIDSKTLGRISSYRLVENLIKTSHVDTEKFQGEAKPIDELSLARKKFLTDGNEKAYRSVMEKHLPTALGWGVKGDSEEGKQLNATVERATKLIADAEISQAKNVSALPQHVLSINGSADLNTMHRQAEGVMSSLDMFDTVSGLDIKRSPQQLYRGLNNAIVDTMKNNKNLLLGGAAALIGINLLGRSEPSFNDSREAMRMHSSDMIHSPARDVENGINTNTVRSAYIQPENYSDSKAVNVQGNYADSGYETYNQFNSMLDVSSPESRAVGLNSALFGGGLRSARLDITDF